jgi:putative ABC transport system permease protein
MRIRAKFGALRRALFGRERLEADLDEELRAYVDELTERKVRAGVAPAAARRAALIESGGVEQLKERVRDARVGHWLDTVLQDVRYAVRGLRRSPGFTSVAVITLALGVGANAAIFSVVDAVLLRPAPVRDLDRLVVLWETDRQSGTTREPASVPDYLDFRARARSVDRIGALVAGEMNLTPPRGDPMRLAALQVSRGLLPMLGLDPIVGRQFTEEEDRAGGPPVVLISRSLWERVFGRDPGVVGRTLRLDEVSFTVVGVVPDMADFGVLQILTAAVYSRSFADRGDRVRVDAWLPLQPNPASSPRDTHSPFMLARLASGVDRTAAQKEFSAIAADLERSYPSNRARGVHVEPLASVVFGPVRPALGLLLGAVALVLLVACVNVANLLLARGAGRAREVAIRAALGAGGRRLSRQFLIESLVLTLIAGAAGVALAQLTLTMLVAMAPSDIPRLSAVAIDWRVLGVTLAVSMAVGVGFGFLPALQARRVDVQATLKSEAGRRASGSAGVRQSSRVLVVVEVSLAVALLAGAGLLIRSFWSLEHVDAGFRATGVLKAEYQLPGTRYPVNFANWPNFKEIHAFNDALVRRVAALPGVDAVTVAGNHPLDPGFTNSFTIVGRESESATFPEVSVRRVTPGYFKTVGLARLRGRLIEDRDATRAPAVLVINQAAATRFFPGRDPIGAQIRFWGAARTIVGVVGDERIHGLAQAAPIAVYAPLAQAPSANGAGVLLVRTSADPNGLVPAIRNVFRAQDPLLAVFGVEPLAQTLSQSLSQRRFVMVLLALFAAVAVALAAIGIHGVLAYNVARRTREFGIRMALGARRAQVLWSVLREAFGLTAFGLVIGVGGTLLLTRFLRGLLFAVAPTDPLTFGAVACFLAVVALVASGIPARAATKVDPAIALRAE